MGVRSWKSWSIILIGSVLRFRYFSWISLWSEMMPCTHHIKHDRGFWNLSEWLQMRYYSQTLMSFGVVWTFEENAVSYNGSTNFINSKQFHVRILLELYISIPSDTWKHICIAISYGNTSLRNQIRIQEMF